MEIKNFGLTWHKIHSFIGLNFSIFFLFLFATGTLAVFSTEIDWLIEPDMRVTPQAEEKVSFGDLYDAAKDAHGNWDIVSIQRWSPSSRFADQISAVSPDGKEYFIWINPYTAEVQGTHSIIGVKDVLRELHNRLFLPFKIGVPLVSAFSLPLTGLVVAALFLYKRFWRGFFLLPRFSIRTRAWTSDLHRLIGVWSLIFLIPLCLNGIWYFAEATKFAAPALPSYAVETQRGSLLPDGFDGATLDLAFAKARVNYEELDIRAIELPRQASGLIAFTGQATAVLVRNRANVVYVDPVTLNIRGINDGEDLNFHQRISEMADPIHFGIWGGTATRIVWLVFGIMLTALAGLGAVIHAKRFSAMAARHPEAELPSGWRAYWVGMGLGKWLSAALVVGGLALLVRYING